MKRMLILSLLLSSCAPQPRLKPDDVFVLLIQLHGAVSTQYEAGGMELEHFNTVNKWIGDEIRVLANNSKQWEGQARLDWPRVKSICVPYENLNLITNKIDRLLQ